MEFIYNKTTIGYSHIEKGIICQDFSENYLDKNYKIVTACDGHGGIIYIRSDRGSKFASQSVKDVITKYSIEKLENLIINDSLEKIKLEILCRWNQLVEEDYASNPFSLDELEKLSENEVFRLSNNFILAYGTTLNAAILTDKYLINIQIGDGGMFFLRDDEMEIVFPENDENVANITNSLCGDDAYSNIFIKSVKKDEYKGIILCTDGLLGPYQTYTNFYEKFVHPLIEKFKNNNKKIHKELDEYIDNLATKIGIGDDVSFASIIYDF